MKIFKDENIRLKGLLLSLAVISLGMVTSAFAYKPALHQEFSDLPPNLLAGAGWLPSH